MRAAGLIPGGSGIDPTRPTNAYGGLIGIQNGALALAGHVVVFGQIEGAIARILEARLDDSNAQTGRIQSNESTDNSMVGTVALAATTLYSESVRYDMAFRL